MNLEDRVNSLEHSLRWHRRVLLVIGCLVLVGATAAFAPVLLQDPEAFKITTPNASSSPTTRVQVSGNENTAQIGIVNSNVGIGNSAPTQKLDVTGNAAVSGMVRVGTATSATDTGDFSAGLSSGNKLFWDESLGQIYLPVGTAGAPSFSFDGDSDSGFYSAGANNLGISVGGSKVINIVGTATTVTGSNAAGGITLGITNTSTATTSPSSVLSFTSSSASAVLQLISNTDTSGLSGVFLFRNYTTTGNAESRFQQDGNKPFTMYTNGGRRMIVEGDGNISYGPYSYYGGGVGVAYYYNCTTAPTSNPSYGGILYAQSGAGKWRGSSGTTTTFGPAEPHCPRCDRDFALEYENKKYGKLSVCVWCLTEGLSNAGINCVIEKKLGTGKDEDAPRGPDHPEGEPKK